MVRMISFSLIIMGLSCFVASNLQGPVRAQGPFIAVIKFDDEINPFSAKVLTEAMQTSELNGASLIVLNMDTPGGLLDSTRQIVGQIQKSEIPVVVYISPSGSRAASAGTFIVASAHIAAMAPMTNIGAASPVGSGGKELSETLKKKSTQDAAAFIREIAESRGRNASALVDTVINAKAFSTREAFENNIVEIIASDIDELLEQLDGRTIEIAGKQQILETKQMEIQLIEPRPVQKFLKLISDPNIAFLLFTVGSVSLIIELMSPGLVGPGVIGVLSLSLAFMAFGTLPVNWGAVGLLILAIVMLYLELQTPGISIFGVGSMVSFLIGAFLLFGNRSIEPLDVVPIQVNMWLIASTVIIVFPPILFVMRDILNSRKNVTSKPTTPTTPIGEVGVVTSTLNPDGSVYVSGETWSARSDSGETLGEGSEIVVASLQGLTLIVYEADETLSEMLDKNS